MHFKNNYFWKRDIFVISLNKATKNPVGKYVFIYVYTKKKRIPISFPNIQSVKHFVSNITEW